MRRAHIPTLTRLASACAISTSGALMMCKRRRFKSILSNASSARVRTASVVRIGDSVDDSRETVAGRVCQDCAHGTTTLRLEAIAKTSARHFAITLPDHSSPYGRWGSLTASAEHKNNGPPWRGADPKSGVLPLDEGPV